MDRRYEDKYHATICKKVKLKKSVLNKVIKLKLKNDQKTIDYHLRVIKMIFSNISKKVIIQEKHYIMPINELTI